MLVRDRQASAFSVSLAIHLASFAMLLLAMRQAAHAPVPAPATADRVIPRMVWLNAPGPGGGGGGGGDHMKEPARRAEMPGRDAITVPAAKPREPDFSKPATPEPDPIPQLIIPVARQASATGCADADWCDQRAPEPDAVTGAGRRRRRGNWQRTGRRAGHRGRGSARDGIGGTGGGAYQPGNGVTMPVEIKKGVPRYTTEAMRARIQGSIMVECVVETTGACTDIRVKRSFDPAFGLDQEAINAAAQWRFRPGMRLGQAVPVVVTMEIAFALR